MQRDAIEVARLLASSMKEIEKEIFYYAMEGKLIELAVLLMVARTKVMSPSFFKNLSASLFQCKSDSDLGGSMTLREFIITKLTSVGSLQVRPIYDGKRYMLARMQEGSLSLIAPTLLLLDIFEKAGDDIESYLLLQQVRFFITPLLIFCSFFVLCRGELMRMIIESFLECADKHNDI